ncbi:sensor histidine kinase [Nocardiopsis kunsanensis]|uniref:sensor histidine kinase n=1 Tax=Nocardiopsis kunsanensis TaxID=141693 RepID=UPI001EF9FECB|nr:sensor histidine kinase [Nocardiopsis kunsanensis]
MFGKMREWTGRHPVLVDAIVLAPFLLLYVSLVLTSVEGGRTAHTTVPLHLALTLALLLPLALRRTWPVPVFVFVTAVAAVHLGLDVGLFVPGLAVVVALCTVAAHCRPAWALAALGVVEAWCVLAIVLSPHADWGDWKVFALYSFLFMLCWVTGLYVRLRRRYVLGLVERAQWLERERDARAQAAVAAERERIAREMHDVVAHNLSVMVVQAEGATYAVDQDPGRAKGAMETVASTGRSALSEVRGILGLLRAGSNHDEDEYAPQAGIGGLDQVVEQVRAAGLPVEFTVGGERRRLPTGVELAAFRVVQEALTNALKHAGPEVGRVRVEVHYGAETLGLRVSDDGGGPSLSHAEGEGRGQGLIGMRERVSVHGGSLRAGPGPDGGFEVVASLPL